MATRTKRGRRKGATNKGFWFRKGRGWYLTDDGQQVKLCDAKGRHLKRENQRAAAEQAWHDFHANREKQEEGTLYTVQDICAFYLKWCGSPKAGEPGKTNASASTRKKRQEILHDLVHGTTPKGGRRVHKGYGKMLTKDFTTLQVHGWLDAHQWGDSSRAMAIQAIRRAMNYSIEKGYMKNHSLENLKTPESRRRVTYITPEEERALLDAANPLMRDALHVCIYTGCRPGELTALTPEMVKETDDGMEWVLVEHKTRHLTHEDRVILVHDHVAPIIRKRLAVTDKGKPVFPTPRGKRWNARSMAAAFTRLADKVRRQGGTLKDGLCWYSCRHTFAQRMIAGAMPWQNGRGLGVAQLCKVMGNSLKVCWRHYGNWVDRKLTRLALNGEIQSDMT